jgi:hypothetical protein
VAADLRVQRFGHREICKEELLKLLNREIVNSITAIGSRQTVGHRSGTLVHFGSRGFKREGGDCTPYP